jgi:hypothetical protein
MEISEEEQSYTDFDWFCVDKSGNIGHFASAGFKSLPRSVICSAEDLALLKIFFKGLPAMSSGHFLDSNLEPEKRTERQTRSFVDMADRGLFSFDIESYLRLGVPYFRVALPIAPLRLEALPVRIREILCRTVLNDRLLLDSPLIPYQETLEI